MITPRVRRLFLHPGWNRVGESDLDRMLRQSAVPAKPPSRLKSAKPRAGETRDVLLALWSLPKVQTAVNTLLERAANEARRTWNKAGTADRAALITGAAFLAAPAITGIIANQPSREMALDYLDGRDFPVPGLCGFSVHLRGRGRGAGAALANIANTGLGLQDGAAASPDGWSVIWDVKLILDLTRLIRPLK